MPATTRHASRLPSGQARWRLWTLVAVLAAGALILTGRLAQLQIVDHARYAEQARLNHIAEESLLDRRGALLHRNGYPLAASEDAYDVLVERRAWQDPAEAQQAADALSRITGVPAQEMIQQVAATDVFELPVARGLSYQQASAVRELGLYGVRLVNSSRRVYPEGSLAAQLIGFVGRDNVGLTGLEADLNQVLGGAPGSLLYERDGLGNQLPLGRRQETAAQPGANVVLTLDRYLQRLAEQELDRAVKEHRAAGGTIIIVHPPTGDILAMANRPTFDLRNLDLSSDQGQDLYRNRAVTDTYEPGSVFKLITTAAGLDTGVVSPGTWWYDSGSITFDTWTIRNWDNQAYGSQTVQGMLSRSLNTGAAWVAQQVGPTAFYDYVARFGFGRPTECGLSGEVGGRVRTPDNDPEWRPVDMATNSFGQGIAVTPLQMAMAVAAIANDGRLMKPRLVKEIAGPTGRQVTEPQAVGQAVSPETAQTLRDMMGVVVDGISKNYLDVKGYRVGGKTGTANVALENGGYKKDAYIASFAGIAPLDNPQLAILVKIDEPQGVQWGSVVAAPAFGRIVQQALPYMKVPPTEPAIVANTGE